MAGRASQAHKRRTQGYDSAGEDYKVHEDIYNNPRALILIAPLPGAVTSGEAYSYTIYASHGGPPYTYSDDGGLPTGLTLNTSTGEVSGTTTETGSHAVVFTVEDANTETANATATFVVS